MTSKEALEKISNHKCYVKESSCYDRVKELYKNEIEVIEQDLERLEKLDQYNLITAPKSIKLSEIVEMLKESNKYLDFEFETTLDFKKAIGVNYKSYDGEYYFDECVVFNENMTIERVCLESTNFKWLYALWIAGTEIIDDMEY